MSVVWKLHCVVKESKNNILDECLFATVSLCVRELVCGWVCVCAKVVCKPVFIHSREKTRSNHRIVLWFLFVSLLKVSSFLCFALNNEREETIKSCLLKMCVYVWMCFLWKLLWDFCLLSLHYFEFPCFISLFVLFSVFFFFFLGTQHPNHGVAWRSGGYF